MDTRKERNPFQIITHAEFFVKRQERYLTRIALIGLIPFFVGLVTMFNKYFLLWEMPYSFWQLLSLMIVGAIHFIYFSIKVEKLEGSFVRVTNKRVWVRSGLEYFAYYHREVQDIDVQDKKIILKAYETNFTIWLRDYRDFNDKRDMKALFTLLKKAIEPLPEERNFSWRIMRNNYQDFYLD